MYRYLRWLEQLTKKSDPQITQWNEMRIWQRVQYGYNHVTIQHYRQRDIWKLKPDDFPQQHYNSQLWFIRIWSSTERSVMYRRGQNQRTVTPVTLKYLHLANLQATFSSYDAIRLGHYKNCLVVIFLQIFEKKNQEKTCW